MIVYAGPSNIGKTYSIREYLLPALLTMPSVVTDMAPPEGYSAALVHDPRTAKHPNGQYPGGRFDDVADWSRALERPKLSCLERPTFEAMCEMGKTVGGLVLVIDELERALEGRGGAGDVIEMLIASRQHNCIVVGGCKRLGNLPTKARSNVEVVFFGNLSDIGDRRDCAEVTRVSREVLDELCKPATGNAPGGPLTEQGTFLEWHRASGWRGLTRVHNRARILLRQL
ncbi:MAG TPA: hypothetical protein VF814_04725 [Casimicrobiaceae bacterium]